ncbi:GTP-binding nuclear protein [Purpureocillium lavendulum]|uniref:ATP-dependent (S)-NAD(P)H-hydrate dehydratase n=1 Tax=Purpureocillium lavendulum TaxID=1247861 RepID=A0AB34G4T3_9HYPO|nr:GTP-binding nuclear protein [Purpureocillium lavendulum]
MANGLDRLERLFTSKRKASPSSSERASPVVQTSEPQFPSPSFIRPKATRMAARDEIRLRQAAGRSPSVPDIALAHRMQASYADKPGSTDGSFRHQHRLARSPSFIRPQQPDHRVVTGLRQFQFPRPPSRNGNVSPISFSPNKYSSDIPQLPSPRCRSPLQVAIPHNRLDTPPASDPEDNDPFMQSLQIKSLPKASRRQAPPTPGQSPEVSPTRESRTQKSKSTDTAGHSVSQIDQSAKDCDQVSLHRSYSQSSIAPSAQISFCSSTLREPDFNEFLNLSDDDIAESTPESPVLPPAENCDEPALPPMDLSISSTQPLTSSLLTLSPPRASRPAAVAAFEAARIARRYDFDLVYVVNLWPDNVAARISGSASDDATSCSKPMVGRLLAAHGLHHVPSPLQISSLVHTTILRSDGWIEYRNQEASSHDLARGYACAFYTGQFAKSTPGKSSPVSGVLLSERIDRGIVFAAYRKPRTGEDRLGRAFNEEQLGDLHREAEALVEMLIDIHVANRLPTRSVLAKVRRMVPPMLDKFHKGQLGRVAVIGGSEDYTGAPYFSAMASARLGCDMTYSPNLMVHPLMRQSPPEKSQQQQQHDSDSDAEHIAGRIVDMLPRLHVLVVGPGLGRDPLMQATVARVIHAAREREMPVVLDADALLVVQQNPGLVKGYAGAVLTPNVVEFKRLWDSLGLDEPGDGAGETGKVEALARALGGVTIIQKGGSDFISNGKTTLTDDLTGGKKRSGGQGDTLTGSVATFLAWRKAYMDRLWNVGDSPLSADEMMGLAAFGGSAVTRGRSLQASDLTDEIHTAFLGLFGEVDGDSGAKL